MTHLPKRHTLQWLAKLTIICFKLCKESLHNLSRTRNRYESVLHMLDEYDTQISWRGLTFRTRDYRAKKQQCLKPGARHLLEQEPSTRSKDDINKLLSTLRSITALAKYPNKMQRQLCQVGRLECYEAKRVIVREGDFPHTLYFILSGTVLMTGPQEETGASHSTVTLNTGMSFDELAIISGTRRLATAWSKTDVELLSVSRSEFEEVLVACGRDMFTSDTQKQFFRGVAFLRYWPIEQLRRNSQACTVYYFNRNQVVVQDSNNSDRIYIVLKGSLRVMKKMKRVEPFKSRKRRTLSLRELAQEYYFRKTGIGHFESWDQRKRSCYNTVSLSCNNITPSQREMDRNSPEVFKSTHDLEARLEQTLPGYNNSADRLGCLDYYTIISNFRFRLLDNDGRSKCHTKQNQETCTLLDNHTETAADAQDISATRATTSRSTDDTTFPKQFLRSKESFVLPNIAHTNKVTQGSQHARNNGVPYRMTATSSTKQADDEEENVCLSDKRDLTRWRRRRIDSNIYSKGVYLTPNTYQTKTTITEPSSPEMDAVYSKDVKKSKDFEDVSKAESLSGKLAKKQPHYQGRKTVASELDQKTKQGTRFTEPELDPTIIQLQVLERREYFPSLTVVSNGAECLVMSKKLFLQWASEKCLGHLRRTEFPYPTDKELRQKVQELVTWQAVRTGVYEQVAEQIHRKKENLKQFLPAYQGQYCFRAGPV